MESESEVMYTIFVRNSLTAAALTSIVWDGAISLHLEYEYIWRSRWTLTKGLFLFSRYFGISVQLINHILTVGPLSNFPVKPETCNLWFHFQFISWRLLFLAFELVLSIRVYALYGCGLKIAILLTSCVVLENVLTSIFGMIAVQALEFNSACSSQRLPYGSVQSLVTMVAFHCTLWGMTVARGSIAVHGIWKRNSIVGLVLREGTWILGFMLVACAIAVLYFAIGHVSVQIAYSWLFSLVSIGTCRAILNTLTLKPQVQAPNFDPEFSTHIYTLDMHDISSNNLSQDDRCSQLVGSPSASRRSMEDS